MSKIRLPISGYEGYYTIDDSGNVYSVPRNGTINKIKKLKRNTLISGYQQYLLQKNGVINGFFVHRLVAKTFIPNPENKPFVNHKDGIKSNNHVSNLEWATRSENEKHAHINGLKNFKGRKVKRSKTTQKMAKKIREYYHFKKATYSKMSLIFGLSKSYIGKIARGGVWE